jgi:hypothetical protein
MMTAPELIAECLVDGTAVAEHDRRAISEPEIRAAALALAEQLEGEGERKWAKRLRRAASRDEELLPCYKLSHILYWLRRDRCLEHRPEVVDVLPYAIGLRWPPLGRPPGPPRTTFPFIP